MLKLTNISNINTLPFCVCLAFRVSQPYSAVGRQGQVSLQCIINKRPQPEEMYISIYKGMYGEERICSAYVNISNPYIETNGRVYCRGNVNMGRVNLTIFGLRGEDTDLYRCRVEAIFPPPYISQFGNGTMVRPGKRCSWTWHSFFLYLHHSSLMFAHLFTYLQCISAKRPYLISTFHMYSKHNAAIKDLLFSIWSQITEANALKQDNGACLYISFSLYIFSL